MKLTWLGSTFSCPQAGTTIDRSSICSLTMKKWMPHTVATIGTLAVALSGCAAGPTPAAAPEPPPTASATADSRATGPDSISFEDGATLPPGTDISWGDGFAHDDGWHQVEHLSVPGRWTYVNADETCFAAFRGGVLGDAGDMNDKEASDAIIAAELGENAAELGELLADGSFIRFGTGDGLVEHRQFSFTIDGVGRFIAARAFVALNYSVQVMVLCDGVDVSAAAEEVLSKNVIAAQTSDG